jgi:ketosteroid isomerase-like protein
MPNAEYAVFNAHRPLLRRRFISVAMIENRKIIRWRDYTDSLAVWMASTVSSGRETMGARMSRN